MHIASAPSASPASAPPRDLIVGEPGSPVGSGSDPRFSQYKVIRRNGSVVSFEPSKITIAMTKAFLAINGGQGAASARVREEVTKLTDGVVAALVKRKPEGGAIHIEEIQDQVELQLMRGGEHEVARAYVLYRERRSQERAHAKTQAKGKVTEPTLHVTDNGVKKPLDLERLTLLIKESCEGLGQVEPERILKATLKDLYDGVAVEEVRKGVVLSARALIEKDPAYSYVTARLLLDALRFEALGEEATQHEMAAKYPEYFPRFVKHGVKIGLLNEALLQFDMKSWARRSSLSATRSSAISACRRCTTAISSSTSTSAAAASSCRNASLCALRWAWHSTKCIAKRAPSSSTTCCPRSTSCRARPRCSIRGRIARSCRRAT
jgi:ribonucleoside-diphosphate reductase alpha chain